MSVIGLKGATASLSEYQIKGLFLVNFIKYVDWPEASFSGSESPVVIGIIGVNPFDEHLKRIINDKEVKGRKVMVIEVQNQADVARCHLLFIAKSERNRVNDILRMVGEKPILTVGEDEAFLDAGGVINFVLKNEKIRLEINLIAVSDRPLSISSRLLNVADVVKR